MTTRLKIFTTDDKPALLCLSTPLFEETVASALIELGHKVNAVHSHNEFTAEFFRVPYQIVMIDCAAQPRAGDLGLGDFPREGTSRWAYHLRVYGCAGV